MQIRQLKHDLQRGGTGEGSTGAGRAGGGHWGQDEAADLGESLVFLYTPVTSFQSYQSLSCC